MSLKRFIRPPFEGFEIRRVFEEVFRAKFVLVVGGLTLTVRELL